MKRPTSRTTIKFTRFGYDLDKIETVPFDVDTKLSAADIANNDATIKNIRLWDHAPLLKTYSQLQQIRTYYKFFDVDNDRYMVNGQYTQVMLSPRELSYADLPSKNWINERLIFTHGNGITFGPVSRISKEGLPEFFVKDIPAVSLADIKVTRPEIYYGELSNDYVVVKTRVPEFSYPTATGNINTTYAGKGGVPIDSTPQKGPLRRQIQDGKDPALVRYHRREPHPLQPQHQRAGQSDSALSSVSTAIPTWWWTKRAGSNGSSMPTPIRTDSPIQSRSRVASTTCATPSRRLSMPMTARSASTSATRMMSW